MDCFASSWMPSFNSLLGMALVRISKSVKLVDTFWSTHAEAPLSMSFADESPSILLI